MKYKLHTQINGFRIRKGDWVIWYDHRAKVVEIYRELDYTYFILEKEGGFGKKHNHVKRLVVLKDDCLRSENQ